MNISWIDISKVFKSGQEFILTHEKYGEILADTLTIIFKNNIWVWNLSISNILSGGPIIDIGEILVGARVPISLSCGILDDVQIVRGSSQVC